MHMNCHCRHCIVLRLEVLQTSVNAVQASIDKVWDFLTKRAVDLKIVLGETPSNPTKGSVTMPNKKATGPAVAKACLAPSGHSGAARALVQPDVTLTSAPSSITLQPLDANGNPVGLSPSDTATGTLSSDTTSFTIATGADSTHYVATIPANTPLGTVVNLSATLIGTIQGAQADLKGSLKITLNIPPVPVAVDLEIVLG